MKKLFYILAITLISLPAFGQAFDSAVGLRFGSPVSVTYKKFFNEEAAGEVYLGYRSYFSASWLSVNAAYQIHKDLEFEGIENLQWYYGGGAGINRFSYDFDIDAVTFFSVSGYLGLSYTFDNIPLNLSVDWVPSLFFGNDIGLNTFGGGYGALSARYILNQ